MSENIKNKIVLDYWINKLKDKDSVYANASDSLSTQKVLVKDKDLNYFKKVSNQQRLVENTIFLTIYTVLAKKYFSAFNGLLFSAMDYDLLMAIEQDSEATLKEVLQSAKSEIQETYQYKEYDPTMLRVRLGDKGFSNFTAFALNYSNTSKQDRQEFDCQLNVNKQANGTYEIWMEYKANFSKEYILDHFLISFKNILIALEENLSKPLPQITLLRTEDKQQIFDSFNATQESYPTTITLLDLFRIKVKNNPAAIAAKFGTKEISFGELDIRSNQLAHYLLTQGLQAEDLVPICFERSLEMLVAIVGILKAGGAYLPLDTSHPEDRINFILKDSEAKMALTQKPLAHLFKAVNVLCLEEFDYANYSSNKVAVKVLPRHLAYAIYTSGTTGQPKGVLNEHGGLLNRLFWMRDVLHIDESDTLLQKTAYTFDVSVWEFTLPLITGSKLVFAEPEGHKDPLYMQQIIAEEKISLIHFVPSMLGAFLEAYQMGTCDTLQHVVCSGEALSSAMVERFKKYLPQTSIHNLYGPTEAAIDVSYIDLSTVDTAVEGVSIGKAVANTQLYIVDEQTNLLPVGVEGELLIGGIQVARGYLKRPDLSKEKFIKNPFDPSGQSRLYKTGDIARWLPDGSIDFLGRKDHQVKIRGNRVELEEIENVISQFSPKINQVALLIKDFNGEKILVAYVATKDLDKAALRQFLLEKLPDYMIPGFFIELESMPLTANGKLNRRALPEVSEQDSIKAAYVAPSTKIEEQLVAIWETVLGVKKIGVTDNFFALGGHSLKVTQLVNTIRLTIGVELKIKNIFKYPSIRGISTKLSTAKYIPIPQAPIQENYPLTAAQKRLWVLCQFEGANQVYNMPASFELSGSLNVAKLEQAFKMVIAGNESLRTYFQEDPKLGVRQYIIPANAINFQLKLDDYSDRDNKEQLAKTAISKVYQSAFDLSQAPLVQGRLIKLGALQHVLVFCMHHLVGDGWSVEVLTRQVTEIYNCLVNGNPVIAPPPAIQYKDYAVWLESETQQQKLAEQEAYWLNHFSGELPVLDLPAYQSRPLLKTYNGALETHEFSKEFSDEIIRFSATHQATLFMTLMAGLNGLFYRYTNHPDIILGTPIAGRDHPDLENQIGLLLNTIAIRTPIDGSKTLADLLAVQKSILLDAYENQDFPFDLLVEKLKLKPDTSRSALFDVMVVLHNQKDLAQNEMVALEGIHITPFRDVEKNISHFDMAFEFSVEAGCLHLEVEYNTDIYEASLMKQMVLHLENFMKATISDQAQKIDEVIFLTEAEKEKLLNEFNDTNFAYPKEKTIVDLFGEKAKTNPDEIAIVFKDRKLTYSELEKESNQLANFLIVNYDIGIEDLVALKLDRSDWLVISILAILKTGAAYIPIDTKYPEARIQFIEEDSQCKLIVDKKLLTAFKSGHVHLSSRPNITIRPENLAYIIYTSGTTGKPKGVMIEHKNLVNLCYWHIDTYKVSNASRQSLFSSVAFDASVWEIFPALISGASLYPILEDEVRYDPASLIDFMSEHGITHTFLPPQIVAAIIASNPDLEKVCFLTGGDVLKVSNPTKLKIFNNYGPTENTVVSTYFDTDQDYNLRVPIGKPVHNTQVYILSENLSMQPIGVIGELCVSGDSLARGYLNRPELTEEKFVNHPFKKDQRMYRTGDLARWLPDGNIDFIGRKDTQIKIRGHRIELEEIARVLDRQEEVNNAIVVVKEILEEKTIVAYIDSKEALNRNILRSKLKEELPDYMIPSYYVAIEKVPLTTNGKIDYKALPEVDEKDMIRKVYVAPTNPMEAELVKIWEEVLNLEKIGTTDNFFELGGHSLKATQLLSIINQKFNTKIDIQKIFVNPSIKAIALEIENANWLEEIKTKKEVKKIII